MFKHLLLLVFLSFSICQHQSVGFSVHDEREEYLTQLRIVRDKMSVRVYYDSSDEPNLVHVQEIVKRVVYECSNDIGLDITVISFEPLEGLEEKNAPEIRMLANNKYPESNYKWVLFVTNTIALSGRFIVEENMIDGSSTVSYKIEQAYGFCSSVYKSIALYNFGEQYNTGDQTGRNVARNCMTHELGHKIGLSHNPDICSVMFETSGQGYGQWTNEDLRHLVELRNPNWHCDFK